MKKTLLLAALAGLLVAACGASPVDTQATVAAQVAATVAAQPTQPPQQVPVEVPVTVQVPVEVPVTVIVPVTVAPTETSAAPAATAAPADTSAPAVTNNPQDPMAGANPTPIIAEDFVLPDFWYEFDSSSGSGAFVDGAYTLVSIDPENVEWTFNGRKTANIYLTAKTVVPDTKCKAGDHWGVIFRYRDNANFYMFGVSCDGKYRLAKRVDGVFEVMVDLTDSNAILKLGQNNTVGVRAVGDQISMYANDQYLATVNDGSFAEGLVGMYVWSRLTPGLTVVFDDVTVYLINQ
ncbi:MAG: hypothetical protein HYY33_03770 [Chloroflexi bacterium]|nr:hypothetical protein [Chloroflexota bacterium]MBI4316584.1 hypothetical protein [Chloroflexota bacterium]